MSTREACASAQGCYMKNDIHILQSRAHQCWRWKKACFQKMGPSSLSIHFFWGGGILRFHLATELPIVGVPLKVRIELEKINIEWARAHFLKTCFFSTSNTGVLLVVLFSPSTSALEARVRSKCARVHRDEHSEWHTHNTTQSTPVSRWEKSMFSENGP